MITLFAWELHCCNRKKTVTMNMEQKNTVTRMGIHSEKWCYAWRKPFRLRQKLWFSFQKLLTGTTKALSAHQELKLIFCRLVYWVSATLGARVIYVAGSVMADKRLICMLTDVNPLSQPQNHLANAFWLESWWLRALVWLLDSVNPPDNWPPWHNICDG